MELNDDSIFPDFNFFYGFDVEDGLEVAFLVVGSDECFFIDSEQLRKAKITFKKLKTWPKGTGF